MVGLLDLPGTNAHASARDWSFPMSRAEIDARQLLQRVLNLLRGDTPPILLDWPWPSESDVTEEEREALTQQLIARSALAGR